MTKPAALFWIIPTLITLASLMVWQATGGDAYTKFTVVERVEVKTQADDPLSGTGMFDEAEPRYETMRRDEFRLGLLPTPQGLFDKHAISVASVVGPVWVLSLGGWWIKRRILGCPCCATTDSPTPESTET